MSEAALLNHSSESSDTCASEERAHVEPTETSALRDVLELTKPRITLLEVTMMLGGLALAPLHPSWVGVLGAAIGTALVVAAANAFNMYLERDSDALMERTRHRPLPAGRMHPGVALAVALVGLVASMIVLTTMVNWLTAVLGFVGFASYVFVYTPLKRYSTLALAVGAVPGAMPALMGWTAAMGSIGTIGLLYAGILFFWQIPHFLAIALYRSEDYERASLVVTPNVAGEKRTRIELLGYTIALIAVSLMLVPAGAASWLYLVVATGLGAWFLALVVAGMAHGDLAASGRRIFIGSLIYLPMLALGLVVDVVVG